jgi:hypothetical protein
VNDYMRIGRIGDMKKIAVAWSSYLDGHEPLDQPLPDMDGNLIVSTGPYPGIWEGEIVSWNVVPAELSDYASWDDLYMYWSGLPTLQFEDQNGDAYTVFWDSDFDIVWDGVEPNSGVLPFRFVRYLTT